MEKHRIETLITQEEVEKRIRELGETINREYAGKELRMVCVLNGGAFFMCELAKHITVPCTMDFITISSYGSGTESSGRIKLEKDLKESIEGKHVLVVEDIIDSGRTLSWLLQTLSERNPQSIRLCTLLDKPDRRVVEVKVDHVCFTIPDEFVVGYGLDYDQYYRNLPYIGVVRFE